MTALRDNLQPSTYPIVFSSLRFPKPRGLFSGPHVLKLMLNQKDCLPGGLIGFGQRMSLSKVNPRIDHFFSPPNHDCENVNHANYNEWVDECAPQELQLHSPSRSSLEKVLS